MTRRTLAIVLACALSAGAGPKAKELLRNGKVGGGAGWNHTPGAPTVAWKVDRGALHVANTDADDRAPHNWFTRFDVPKGAPYRLKLTVRMKTRTMAPGAKANVMVQVYPAKGRAVGYAWCQEATEDKDWHEIHTVFHVPEGAAYVRVLSYLVGKGEAWFDDYSVKRTTEELTAAPSAGGGGGKYWTLARGAASQIEWEFDAPAALARARKERKPVFVYVRCVDDDKGLESAQATLEAKDVRAMDDGLAKDILFRAGPLSDPDVIDLVNRRFVPCLVTFHFGTLGTGRGTGMAWWHTAGAPTVTFALDDEALHIANTAAGDATAHNWAQNVTVPAGASGRYRLRARIRTEGLAKGAEACVMLQSFDGQKANGGGRVTAVRKNAKWTSRDTIVTLPPGTKSLVVRAYLVGKGKAWFDDLSVAPAKGKGGELLKNGAVDPDEGGDPLRRFGTKAAETVTPALLVTKADGTPVRRLHRIGTISTDLVDHWLRTALAEAGARSRAASNEARYRDGELEKVAAGRDARLKAKALLRLGRLDEAARHPEVKGYVHLRRGEWTEALDALRGKGEAERFWRAWCLHRLGRHDEATEAWKELAGESPYGRKAAACLIPAGPRLWLSESARAWPRSRVLPEQTEGLDPDGFDPARSIGILLELQHTDGSFGSHRGLAGYGYWDGAMTAFGAEALWRWLDHAPAALKERMGAAHDRAIAFLDTWAGRPGQNGDAFNNPYVLMHLVRVGRKGTGARVVERIRATQKPDGNWTVYQVERPASFNTALSVIALAQAKAAGWPVPEETLARGVRALAAMRQPNDLFPYSTMRGHEWMTTEHGSIARDPLCEHALLLVGAGDRAKLARALERWARFGHELRRPTKNYYDYFNSRGHGGYYFFFAHRNAYDAAAHADDALRTKTRALVRTFVLQSMEGDGAFMDHYMNGRGYGTAQALILLAPPVKK